MRQGISLTFVFLKQFKTLCWVPVVFAFVCICGNSARGQAVTLTLSINDDGAGHHSPGAFAIYGQASTIDGNRGIAAYAVNLSGYTSINNVSPFITYIVSDSFGGPAGTQSVGFAGSRSSTSAVQIPSSESLTVVGMGQTSGDVAAVAFGLPAFDHVSGVLAESPSTAYGVPVLLETGTFDGSGLPAWGASGNSAVVFDSPSNVTLLPGSGLNLDTVGVPEPMCAGVVFLGAAMLARRRSKA